FVFFFFQAEDGIRDRNVTGVQTCALPISVGKYFGGDLMIKPSKLQPGDTVALVSLSSGLAGEEDIRWRTEQGIERLESIFGLTRSEERRVGKECGSGRGGQH